MFLSLFFLDVQSLVAFSGKDQTKKILRIITLLQFVCGFYTWKQLLQHIIYFLSLNVFKILFYYLVSWRCLFVESLMTIWFPILLKWINHSVRMPQESWFFLKVQSISQKTKYMYLYYLVLVIFPPSMYAIWSFR